MGHTKITKLDCCSVQRLLLYNGTVVVELRTMICAVGTFVFDLSVCVCALAGHTCVVCFLVLFVGFVVSVVFHQQFVV